MQWHRQQQYLGPVFSYAVSKHWTVDVEPALGLSRVSDPSVLPMGVGYSIDHLLRRRIAEHVSNGLPLLRRRDDEQESLPQAGGVCLTKRCDPDHIASDGEGDRLTMCGSRTNSVALEW